MLLTLPLGRHRLHSISLSMILRQHLVPRHDTPSPRLSSCRSAYCARQPSPFRRSCCRPVLTMQARRPLVVPPVIMVASSARPCTAGPHALPGRSHASTVWLTYSHSHTHTHTHTHSLSLSLFLSRTLFLLKVCTSGGLELGRVRAQNLSKTEAPWGLPLPLSFLVFFCFPTGRSCQGKCRTKCLLYQKTII